MISILKPKTLLYRDGTGRHERITEALSPEYVLVDERNTEDLIWFAQEYSKELNFFNENNEPDGDWEAFLIDDIEQYRDKSEEDKKLQRKKQITELVQYISNPEKFEGNKEKFSKLSRPHLALFLTFLLLLEHIKRQINTLTKKHLDFFYLEALSLEKKKPVPDMVNVLIELADDVGDLLLQKGALLSAGKDRLGKDLVYSAVSDYLINKAEIQSLKNLFVEKKIIGTREAHEENRDEADGGFLKMMELALGDPAPGDPLPAFPSGVKDLNTLYQDLLNGTDTKKKSARVYVESQLFMTVGSFAFVMDTQAKDLDPKQKADEQEWDEIYDILEDAYKEKLKWQYRQELKNIREQEIDKATGFKKTLEHALGDPDPGNSLPVYNDKPGDVYTVYDDLKSRDDKVRNNASSYVREELYLTERDFVKIIQTSRKDNATEDEWQEVYAVLEKARRKKRNIVLPAPQKEEWANIYATPDVKATAFSLSNPDDEKSKRFKTFGEKQSGKDIPAADPANIGFAIASPLLWLCEGERNIRLTLSFNVNDFNEETIGKIMAASGEQHPFLYYLSTEKEWLKIEDYMAAAGNFIVAESSQPYTGDFAPGKSVFTKKSGENFSELDQGSFLVTADGTIYEIVSVNNAGSVKVREAGNTEKQNGISKYGVDGIYFNALQLNLKLKESDPPITPISKNTGVIPVESKAPVLGIILNNIPIYKDGKISYVNCYQKLKDLRIQKANITTRVIGIKALTIQNNASLLNPKKPFEPFGSQPESGTSFYLAHPEICSKKLTGLEISIEWMKPPALFDDYYKNYAAILKSENLSGLATEIKSNEDFRGELLLHDNRAVFSLSTPTLFNKDDARKEHDLEVENIPGSIQKLSPRYNYAPDDAVSTPDEAINWNRYFQLELMAPDFQHTVYSTVLTRQAISQDQSLKNLIVNAPYTPKIKGLSAGYTASVELDMTLKEQPGKDRAFYIRPFGYNEVETVSDQQKEPPYFLPHYANEGELYIGIKALKPPQNLSVLFQMAEGSANPDVTPPTVNWSFLNKNKWIPFPSDKIISDTTNGLLNTGILTFDIPEDATNGNTLLLSQLFWLRAIVERDAEAISDTVDILSQSITASFSDENNDPGHYDKPLPPESIKNTVTSLPQIKKVHQPYTSFKGKPAETDEWFYTRVSERLRHKNRAVTMWDYERMVLEQFPEIYKVKCLPGDFASDPGEIGKVYIIAIPDIKGRLPFNPFQPKISADTIVAIHDHLEQQMPPFAEAVVKNPEYTQVKTRFAVRFKPGYNEGFLKKELEDELKKFLSPWAYDEGADIVLGGKIYASAIVNFIAEKPYVDYVARIKLFQSEDGEHFVDVRTLNDGDNVVLASKPDVILVSAQSHDIDIISDKGYEEEDFTGINYMRIELDFIVGEDILR